MKLPLVCAQCMRDDIANANFVGVAEFRDEGPYEVNCPKGHRSFVILQEQRFEILFAIGGYAILDGYYREAVSSFTSSLERLFEFFIRAALIEQRISNDRLEDAWKAIAQQSERQLGAFIFLYLREIGIPPVVLSSNDMKFRNDVIHRGKIPFRHEAIAYGDHILTLARPIVAVCKQHFPKGVQTLIGHHLLAATQKADHQNSSTITIPTILSLTRGEGKSLEEELSDLEKWWKFVASTRSSS